MALVDGTVAEFEVATVDLSDFIQTCELKGTADGHNVTTLGNSWKLFKGGLKSGTFSLKGWYDGAASGTPKAVLEPALGTQVAFEYRPEGTGTGKAQMTGNAVITAYGESVAAEEVTVWSAELQVSGAPTFTDQ